MSIFDNFLGVSGAQSQNPYWLVPDGGQSQYGANFAGPGSMPQYQAPAPDNSGQPPRSKFRLIQTGQPQQQESQTNDGGATGGNGVLSEREKVKLGYLPYKGDDTQYSVGAREQGGNYFDEAAARKAYGVPDGKQTNDGANYPNYFSPQDPNVRMNVGLREVPQPTSGDGRVDPRTGIYDDRTQTAQGPNGLVTGSLPPGDANGPYRPGQGASSIAQGDQPAPTIQRAAFNPASGLPNGSSQGQAQGPNPTYSNTDTKYIDQVKKFEGFAQSAKWDYKQNTNGYGTKALYPGEKIDRPEAERRFQVAWGKSSNAVDSFKSDLPQGVRAALTDLTFNSGTKWQSSGLGKAIQNGDYFTAKRLMLQYVNAGGRPLGALVARRQQTASWFNDAIIGQKYATGAVNGFWKSMGGV